MPHLRLRSELERHSWCYHCPNLCSTVSPIVDDSHSASHRPNFTNTTYSPYNFDSSAQGLVFASPLVGSLLGTYLCGPLADRIANYYTKKNDGIREPEMRLPTCAIAATLTFVGALVLGLCLEHHTQWMGPIVGIGILSTGGQMGATLAMSYALDCHKEVQYNIPSLLPPSINPKH